MFKPHPTHRPIVSLLCATVALSGLSACSNMTETDANTAKGAGVGAVVGAVVGGMTGNKNGVGRGAVIGAAAGAIGGNIWSKKMEEKKAAMEKATQGTGAEVTRTADNQLKLEVPADISFASNSATLEPRLRSVLEQFTNGLQNDSTTAVRIIGHTDDRGSDALNDPLSQRRATSVRDFLADRGIQTTRIEALGRGEREPIADNTTDAGRAKNRRVEIFLREPEVKVSEAKR